MIIKPVHIGDDQGLDYLGVGGGSSSIENNPTSAEFTGP